MSSELRNSRLGHAKRDGMLTHKREIKVSSKEVTAATNAPRPQAAVSNRSKQRSYSITASARATSVDGTPMPSAVAVARLITNSNLVGWMTGRSAGLVPLRMRPT
jgi:hypothetical protein